MSIQQNTYENTKKIGEDTQKMGEDTQRIYENTERIGKDIQSIIVRRFYARTTFVKKLRQLLGSHRSRVAK